MDNFKEQKELWKAYFVFEEQIDGLRATLKEKEAELRRIKERLVKLTNDTKVFVPKAAPGDTVKEDKNIGTIKAKVLLKDGTIMKNIVAFVRSSVPGLVTRNSIEEEFGKSASGTISTLVKRQYLKEEPGGVIKFRSWKGYSNSYYYNAIRKATPSIPTLRNNIESLLGTVVNGDPTEMTAKELQSALQPLFYEKINTSFLREVLNNMEDDGVLGHYVGSRNSKVWHKLSKKKK